MVKRIHTELISDVSGQDAHESVLFGLDGRDYEIDLAAAEAAKFRGAIMPFIKVARRVSGGRRPARASSGYDAKAVRVWARSNGLEVSERGRINSAILEQYRAAGN